MARVNPSPHRRSAALKGRPLGRGPLADAPWILGAWLIGAAIFYSEQWTSAFHRVLGDQGDTSLIIYLCEHWFRVLHGQVSWRSPTFFYPEQGVLGWSDTFFIYQVFYAPLRVIGFDPFIAMQLTIILLSLVGFVSFVYLMRLAWGTPLLVACIGGLVFVFANDEFLHAGRFDLTTVYLVPCALLVGLLAWRSVPDRPLRAAALAAVFGLLWALLFFSTYYIAWFSALAAALLLLIWLIASRGRLPRTALPMMRVARVPLMSAVVAFGLGMIPFLVIYLPVRHSTVLTYAEVVAGEGRLGNLVNVGEGNIWSSVVRSLVHGVNLHAGELSYATTPLVALLAVAGAFLGAWRVARGTAYRPAAARAAALLGTTAGILAVLPLKSALGHPWVLIWHLPGANALRAIDRLQMVTAAVAVSAVVAAATEVLAGLSARNRPTWWRAAVLFALCLTMVEQFNVTNRSAIDDPTEMALLRSVPPPPSSCRSFYVIDTAPTELAHPVYQIYAMLISQFISLPTVNGYSGHTPEGWQLHSIYAPNYQSEVRSWAVAHRLIPGLCELDLATMEWDNDPPAAAPGTRASVGG